MSAPSDTSTSPSVTRDACLLQLLEAGRYTECLEAIKLDRAKTGFPTINSYYLEALAYLRLERLPEGLAALENELLRFPQNSEARALWSGMNLSPTSVIDVLGDQEAELNKWRREFKQWRKQYFSHNGEDLISHLLLQGETDKGLFVDIGAYHPIQYSNTYLLYLEGWRGVNVEANSEAIALFNELRPRDTTVRALVSDRNERREYFRFENAALNGAHESNTVPGVHDNNPNRKLLGTDQLETVTLNQILDQYVGTQKFDLLTIDTEGLDQRILLSLDVRRYRPKVILYETPLTEAYEGPGGCFLKANGYEFVAFYYHTAVFVRTVG